jgi:putative ABC transport system permease protein
MSDTLPSWIRGVSWLHRQCLRLAPFRFRRDFGVDTHAAFVRLVTEAHGTRGTSAALGAAVAGIQDTVRAGVAERVGDARFGLLSGLWLDLARAARVFRRAPLLAGAITIVLAVSAGPVIALGTTLYQGILAPLPYPDADRLVVVTHGDNPFLPGWSVNDYRQVAAFAQVGGIRPVGNTLSVNGATQQVGTYQVAVGTLSMLGAPFAAGRDLRADDGDVVVVTQGFAERHFGSSDAAIGKRITLVRSSPVIVGVLGYAPRLPRAHPLSPPVIFAPHPSADRVDVERANHSTQAIVIARLREGVSVAQAEAEARMMAAAVKARYGGDDPAPALESLVVATAGPMLVPMLLLLGLVAALFVLAATSLAGLVLARAASRAPDTALRRSLGASRWRLTRAWAVEGLVLAVPGALLGAWLAPAMIALVESTLPPGVIPGLAQPPIRLALLGAGVLLTIATGLFAGAPIVAGVLKASVLSSTQMHQITGLRQLRTQSLLIAGQVGASVVLVAVALWLATGLYRTLSRPVGFDPNGLVTVLVDSQQGHQTWTALAPDVAAQFEARFGASRVTAASGIPGMNTSGYVPLRVRADQDVLPREQRPTFTEFTVKPNYFAVLGIPILEGRPFSIDDERSNDGVIILSRSFATRWFPEGAIGQMVSFDRVNRRRVVGVVADVHANAVDRDTSHPAFFTPVDGPTVKSIHAFVIRTDRSARNIAAEARAIVGALDPGATVLVQSAHDAMGLALAGRKVAQNAVIALALLALVLAVVNVYALSAYSVVQRTREIGIRLALGATTTDALGIVMRRGVTWITCGLTVGLAATFVLARPALRAQIANLPTDEHGLLALAVVTVGLSAVVAAWLPARRAAHIEPAVTLRAE